MSIFSFGQEDTTKKKSDFLQFKADKQKTKENDRSSFTIIPLLFYTPETTVGFGIGGQGTFFTKGSDTTTRPSTMFFSGIYTLRNQFLLTAEPQIYLNNEKYLIDGKFLFKIFPDYFWGIGNESADSLQEDFNMQTTMLEVALLRRLKPNVNFGFEYVFHAYDMKEYEQDGLVASTEHFQESIISSGFSMVINFDSRDNYQAPKEGSYYYLRSGIASKVLGSTWSFQYSTFDLRNYFKIKDKGRTTLACQVYLNFTTGRVPFQELSRYGGSIYARGYYLGRYTDNNMYVFQSELRQKLKGKWSMAVFGTAGDVYSDRNEIDLKKLKVSTGGGIRWQIRKGDPSLLRFDFAYGFATKGTGVYFGVNEAF